MPGLSVRRPDRLRYLRSFYAPFKRRRKPAPAVRQTRVRMVWPGVRSRDKKRLKGAVWGAGLNSPAYPIGCWGIAG